ncbi:hypothetical protein UFOVP245_160 [uncultured Caudovirales phage]|uniref:Uncharacterized protein n=1 Tax=uncultured Caudovirales phage TaxID=2100421 RepID=A0A6J7WUN2_9CAUD|nr:hypothetical protein UFOVP245_160 [uncultured Caudovirales phage]
MNFDVLINALMDNVKDADARSNIYREILESCDYSERDSLEEVMGIDTAFDIVAEDFIDDEEEEEYEEDDDYDIDDE